MIWRVYRITTTVLAAVPCFTVTVLGLAIVAGMAFPAYEAGAQQKSDGWSLQELVEVALAQNPHLAAKRSAITAATEAIAVAKGARLPRLDAVGLGEYFPLRDRLLIFRHGFRKGENTFQDAVASYGLEVTLPLYTGGRIQHGISLAEASADVSRFRSALARSELIFNVASTYYTTLRLKRVIAAQETTLRSLRESQRVSRLQQEVGRVARVDELRLETRVSQGESDLASARNVYGRALETLKALINVPAEVFLDVSGTLRAANTLIPIERLREQVLSDRPDIIAYKHEVRARREALGIADSRSGPTVNFKAGYRRVTGNNDGITQDDAQLRLELRMPLYTAGILDAGKRKAQAELQGAKYRLLDAERQALAELERAALDIRASGPRISAARRAVRQAEESLRVESQKYSQGRGTSNDLLLSEDALLRSRTQLVAALADSQIAEAALKLAIGQDAVALPSEPIPASERVQ